MTRNCIDTINTTAAPQLSWGQWAKAGVRMLRADILQLTDLVWTWNERARHRHQLRQLDDHILQDVGLSRADLDDEAHKPFWKA